MFQLRKEDTSDTESSVRQDCHNSLLAGFGVERTSVRNVTESITNDRARVLPFNFGQNLSKRGLMHWLKRGVPAAPEGTQWTYDQFQSEATAENDESFHFPQILPRSRAANLARNTSSAERADGSQRLAPGPRFSAPGVMDFWIRGIQTDLYNRQLLELASELFNQLWNPITVAENARTQPELLRCLDKLNRLAVDERFASCDMDTLKAVLSLQF